MPKEISNEAFLADVQAKRQQEKQWLEREKEADEAAWKEKHSPEISRDTRIRSMQGKTEQQEGMSDETLLAEIAALRQQQEEDIKADAAALPEKLGPGTPSPQDVRRGAEESQNSDVSDDQ